jgi:glycosyltransferase involved in cell wall biosynthesis
MRILLAHTYYKLPGGEDRVFAAESALLRRNGHEVVEYCQHNDQTDTMTGPQMAGRTIWSSATYSELRTVLENWRPDVCHFHNTFPVMSPSAFYAARAEGAPVVVTLHNYRFLCPAATFMRNGSPCEKCLGSPFPWQAIRYNCYRGSRGASAATAVMLGAHRLIGTWSRAVDIWIALTGFARSKFVAGGFPSDRVVVKPNFIGSDPGFSERRQEFALFVGRLSAEKGIQTLLASWRALQLPVHLKIAGEGPMKALVEEAAEQDSRIEYLGQLSGNQVRSLMKQARVLVFPSVWYEGLPLTVLEAYATGLPVIASNLGSLTGLVTPGLTGLHFEPGNALDLARKVTWCWQDPEATAAMGRHARSEYLASYTAESNYRQLMKIYTRALRGSQSRNERDGAQGDAVIDHVPTAHSRTGSRSTRSRIEAREGIPLDNGAVHGAGGVTEQAYALIQH